MSITHIIVGDEAAKPLQEALLLDENLQGNIITLKDTLGIGPLFINDGENFETIRTNFWKSIGAEFKEDQLVPDVAAMHHLCNNLQPNQQVWFWMAPCVTDVITYYWLLSYFEKHIGVLHCIFINSLPFFNAKGTLFYPKNFSEVLPREMVKCQKLLKMVSPADYEIDGDEWPKLAGENALIRSHEGGKKISSRNDNHLDSLLFNQFQFSNEFVKATKVISQALSKNTDGVSDLFLIHRLHILIADEKLETQGDGKKGLKDLEIRVKKD
jgi:Protein of unknown function/Domain of unknown function (DUF1835)